MKTYLTVALGWAAAVSAQVIDNTDTRVQTTLDPGMKRIGTLVPKGTVVELFFSPWP